MQWPFLENPRTWSWILGKAPTLKSINAIDSIRGKATTQKSISTIDWILGQATTQNSVNMIDWILAKGGDNDHLIPWQHHRKKGSAEEGDINEKKAESSNPTTDAPYRTTSTLARWLLEEYSFGFLSAPQVQRAAQLAETDGINNPELSELASLGSR